MAECGCAGGIGPVMSQASRLWFDGKYIVLTNGTTLTIGADQWLDCRNWRNAWVLIEFQGTGGSSLTAKLQTVPAITVDDTAWQDITSASATLAQSRTLVATSMLAIPLMGVLRMQLSASGNVTGVLRAQVMFKQAG